MNNPASSTKKSKSFICFLFMLFVGIASILTFSACKFSNNSSNQESNFDANGRLKVLTPVVDFIASSNGVIDDNSGSFSWPLQYYYSGTSSDKLKDIGYDQEYLFSNFYSDPTYETVLISTIKPDTWDAKRKCWKNGPDVLYAKSIDLDKYNISYPSFEVVVDGKYFTFQVSVNRTYLRQYTNEEIANMFRNNDVKRNLFIDASPDHNLFTFKYRTGKNNNDGEFIDCPKGMMDYYTNEITGEFCIRFNPQLEFGAVNRYLKVKSLAEGERASSNFSATCAFEAYAMTFEVYSPNSSTLDYGGLEYDADKYYFAYQKTYYNEYLKENSIKTLTGYFPEGRKVEVSRKAPYTKADGTKAIDYNYAFQSWTANAKAENSVARSNKFPSMSNVYNSGLDVLSSETKNKNQGFQVISLKSELQNFTYYKKADVTVTGLSKVVYNYSPTERESLDGATYNSDKLVVVSHNVVNGYKFYANYAKVRGFMLSGSFFAGDNFFTAHDQSLTEVNINLFYLIGGVYQSRLLTLPRPEKPGDRVQATFTSAELGITDSHSHPNGIKVVAEGSYFMVEGLEKDDFIIFSKEGQPLISDNPSNVYGEKKPYSFHSPLMKDKEAFGSTFKGLDLVISSNTYSDRQDVGIIGTQYAEQSNLVVNLYRLKDTKNDETESVPSTYLELLKDTNISYEVIKSVSSFEDENGYITTNIIISLILPSNATLTGYNVETLNNVSKEYYKAGSELYVAFLKYNASTMKNESVDLNGKPIKITGGSNTLSATFPMYLVTKNAVSGPVDETLTSQFIRYDSKYYIYDHKEIGGQLASSVASKLYFYKNSEKVSGDGNPNYLIKEVVGNSITWTELHYEEKNITAKVDSTTLEPIYKNARGNTLVKQSNSGDIYSVSTIANAYLTEMKHTVNSNTQNVYVYYDVKKVGNNYYYTAPIGRQDVITSSDGDTKTTKVEDTLYFGEISNFNDLKNAGKIMLGSDIYSSRSALASAYRNALGSKIILNCYYYLPTIGYNGEPTELHFRQYIRNYETSNETKTVTEFYYESGGKYYRFEGTPVVDETGGVGISTDFFFINEEGIKINNKLKLTGYESLTGNALSNLRYNDPTHYVANKNFKNTFTLDGETYTQIGTSNRYSYNGKEYGILSRATTNQIGRTISMYLSDGTNSFVETKLYFDGTNYFKIVGSTYVYYSDGEQVDENGNPVQKVDLFDIYDTNAISFKTKGTGSYLDRITVTELFDGGQVTVTKNTTQRTFNGIRGVTTTTTSHLCYVVNSYAKYDEDGKVEENYYPILGRGLKEQLVLKHNPTTSNVYNYKTGDGKLLYVHERTQAVYDFKTALIRSAETISGNVDVTVLGKYIVTNDQSDPKIYPSFSSLLTFTEDQAFILDRNANGEFNYYSMDYTVTKNAIEGFPGITLLAGLPYPNPVLSFQVRHKAYETPIINIALDVNNSYYVEVVGSNILSDESNLVRDFTTYAFRDTLENLTQNDYLDKTYWILDRTNFNPIYAFVEADSDDYDIKIGGVCYNYYIYTPETNENGDIVRVPSELTIQNIGLNDNEDVIYASTIQGANGKYYKPLYMLQTGSTGSKQMRKITTDDVLLWKTSSTEISGAPTYDIHSYTQGKDGIIYFNSGSSNDENIICNGLNGISAGATKSSNGFFNYDDVMISGVTYAYRTLASQVNNSSNMSGYQFDKMINILNAFNSKDAYFLTGKESAVLVASPIVKLNDDAGNTYIYRFREWKIYSRYNSEVLYYNRGVTESLEDRYNAILRFTSEEAGYFVMFPVYERVFNIDTGTAVIDGAINQGGGVNVAYNNGDELDVKNSYDDKLYFVNYYKTEYQGKEGYFYGSLQGYPFLYFTGEFIGGDTTKPVFSRLDNVYVSEYDGTLAFKRSRYVSGKVPLFFQIDSGKVNFMNLITSFEEGKPGLVLLSNENGQYSYFGFGNRKSYENDKGFYLDKDRSGDLQFLDIINVSFSATFFYDEINQSASTSSVPLHYNSKTRIFTSLDIDKFDKGNKNFKATLLQYNMKYNSILFENDTIFKLFGETLYKCECTDNCGCGKNCLCNTYSTSVTLSSLLQGGDKVASSTYNIFTVIKRVDNPLVNELYVSRLGSLSAGELVKDENGNLYSTQQFKTAYIDRDSHVELQAVPQSGYRFEGWYKCVYDKEGGFWYTTDEKVTNSGDIYSDEILQAVYNEDTKHYYYVTSFYSTYKYKYYEGDEEKVKEVTIYYYDSDKKEEAVVPTRMLDKVRGYFINTGTNSAPNYVQVYPKGVNIGAFEYYYEANFINRVDLSRYDVEERTYLSSIRQEDIEDAGYTETWYFLSNAVIFFNPNNNRYYRSRESGNVVIEGNKLIIKTLHSNIRYVAKFIETYNEYIFAEDEESSGIKIQAVYYSNSDTKTDADGYPIIRTDVDGVNHTAGKSTEIKYDYIAGSVDRNLFPLYEEKKNKKTLLSDNMAVGKYQDENGNKTYQPFRNLINGVWGAVGDTYRVNEEDPIIDGKLNLKSMYFDVDTTVHIVVRVKSDFELSIHSLGVNSRYTLVPIFSPTQSFIEENQKANSEDKIDYLYYIFKLTFNRDPNNRYSSYIVHPNRGENMAYDALVGNYITFYKQYFNFYDNNGNIINYTVDNATGKIRLSTYYLSQICTEATIVSEVAGKEYDNIEKALYDLCLKMKKPGTVYCESVYLKANVEGFERGKYSKLEDIFSILKQILKQSGKSAPYIIRSGQRNFINLSTIPIFNYTIQALLIDSEGDQIKYDEKTNKIILPSLKLDLDNCPLALANALYTTGGINGKTYLGTGTTIDISGDPYIYKRYDDGNVSITTMPFDSRHTEIEYALGEGGKPNPTLFQDLTFVQNSIILFEGIQKAPSGYLFAGWYEQKYDRDNNTWSELVFMSNDEQAPYVSLATADTVVVAIYKRAVEVTFEYDNREMAYEMSNGLVDSTGNKLTIVDNPSGGIVTLSGKFFFDAKIEAILSPAGGYRFNGINYTATAYDRDANGDILKDDDNNVLSHLVAEGNSLGKYFKFSNYIGNGEFTECEADDDGNTYTKAILNSILKVEFNLNTAIRSSSDDHAVVCDKLVLRMATKKLTLVYFSVENFMAVMEGRGRYALNTGYNFALIRKSSGALIEEVLFQTISTYGASINYTEQWTIGKDSTNADIMYDLSSDLSVYGYFDNDLVDSLVLVTMKDEASTNTIREWYLNGNMSQDKYTAYYPELSSNYNIKTSGFDAFYKFDIEFEYAGSAELETFNGKEYFALARDNAVYYAKAIIDTGNLVTNISHRTVENIHDISNANSSTVPTGATVNTLLSFNGRLQNADGAGSTLENDAIAADLERTYVFETGSTINLKAYSSFIIVDGKLYVFVGWFYKSSESDSTVYLISYNSSIYGKTPKGYFEAIYVRANAVNYKVTPNMENADITFESVQQIDEIRFSNQHTESSQRTKNVAIYNEANGVSYATDAFATSENSVKYVLVGADLSFTVTPIIEHMIESCVVVGKLQGNLNVTASDNPDFTNAKDYVVSAIEANDYVEITAQVQKGYIIKIKQTIYSSFDMSTDGKDLTDPDDSTYSYVHTTLRDSAMTSYDTLNEIVVPINTTVEFRNTTDKYYFIGYFINGEIVSKVDEKYLETYSQKITGNLIIEARYTYYNYVAVTDILSSSNSRISGSFEYTLSYINPRTNLLVKHKNVREVYAVPAGIVADLKLDTKWNSNPFKFVGFKLLNTYGYKISTLSTEEETKVSLTLDKRYAYNNASSSVKLDGVTGVQFVYIGAVYETATTLTIKRNITLGVGKLYETDGSGKNMTVEQLNGMFNIFVEYTDPSGVSQRISMPSNLSSLNSLSGIEIKKGTSFNIIPVLDPAIKHRYMVYDFEFKDSGISKKHLVTVNDDGTYTVEGNSTFTSLEFTVYFRPCKIVTLVKEILDEESDDPNVVVDYSYTDSNRQTATGSISDTSLAYLNVNESDTSINLSASVSNSDYYMFVGWYIDGEYAGKDLSTTITNASVITAKFVRIVSIEKVKRTLTSISGNETDITNNSAYGNIYITGNFVEGNDYSVETKILNDVKTGAKIVAGTKLSLYTERNDGLHFLRFMILKGNTYDYYSLDNNNADKESDGYSAVTTEITTDISISVDFENEYDITYHISTINSELTIGDGLTLLNNEAINKVTAHAYYNSAKNNVVFYATLLDNYALRSITINGYSVEFVQDGDKYTCPIPASQVGKNLVVKLNVYEYTTVRVYVSLGGTKPVNPTGLLVSINGTNMEPGYSSGYVQNTQIYAYDALNIGVRVQTYTYGSTTYKFDGFYLYDGSSLSTSVSPIAFATSFRIYANKSISIVAKFEPSKMPVTVTTKYLNDNGSTNFQGWYARVNDTSSAFGYRDILVSKSYYDKNSLNGKFSIITAKYSTYETETVGSLSGVTSSGHAEIYTNSSSLSAISTTVSRSDASSFVANNLVSGNSRYSINYIADKGYSVTTDGAVSQKHFLVEVITKLNRVDSNRISANSTDLVQIVEENKTVNVKITIPSTIGSELDYSILPNNIEKTPIKGTLKTGTLTFTVTVPVGSAIYLSYRLAKFEKFINYSVKTNSATTYYSTAQLAYRIPQNATSIEIVANFAKAYTSTIYENDNSKGSASLEIIADGAEEVLYVDANDGYSVSAIYVAEISENGTIGSFVDVLNNATNLANYLGSVNAVVLDSTADSFGDKYITSVEYTFAPIKHIAFKIEYKKITTVEYKFVKDYNVTETYKKYYTEDQTPLTLAEIEKLNLPAKSTDSKYAFANYTYNSEIITDTTKIDLVDNNIIIFVNFNRGYNLQVRVNLVKDGGADYATPSNGITVTLDDGLNTLVATDQISNVFAYLLINAISVKTVDANNYYEFVGYYSSKYQSSSTLLSTIATYSFGAKDIASLSSEEIDGETVLIIYATLKERIQTLTVEKDYEMDNFNLYHDGTKLDTKTTNQIVSSGANGNIAYRVDDNGNYVLTYPYSILSSDLKFEIKQEGFNEITDDPMILNNLVSTSVFYEKQIGDSFYRFDNFYNENDFAVGTKYSASYTINFKDYRIGGKIVAKLVKLNQIEFIYDISDENIIIKIQLLNVVGGTANYIDVASSNGKATVGEAILTYRAEEGTALRVFVDFKDYIGEKQFSSILVSDKDEDMLSKILSSADQIATISWATKLSNYTAVSKYMNAENPFNGYISANKTSAFNFTPTSNMSFVADFIGGFIDFDRSYISSAFYTPGSESGAYSRLDSASTINGKGFQFRADTVGTRKYTYVYDSRQEHSTNTSYIDQSNENKTLTVGKTSVVSAGQLNFHSIFIPYAFVELDAQIVLKSQNGVGYIAFDNFASSTNGRKPLQMNDQTTSREQLNSRAIDAKRGVEFSAPAIEGFIFKGFAIVSAAYSSAYDIMQLSGENGIVGAETLNIIGYDHYTVEMIGNQKTITRFFSKKIAVSGQTRVIAIYEPRVYIIKVNTYKYYEDNELGDTDENRMFEDQTALDNKEYSPIDAATIKGSLLVQHDQSIKITSINYQFIQFAGISTISALDSKNIRFAYDTGAGTNILDIDDVLKDNSKYYTNLSDYKKYLHEKEIDSSKDNGKNMFVGKLNSKIVIPGQIKQDDGEEVFVTSASRNNFYALHVTQDFTVNFFYTALSYNLLIDLAETESTYVYGALAGGNGKGNSSTYLAYSEEVRSAAGWKNPSAGTYTYEVDYGTNNKNSGNNSYKITIDEKDPFVYVANDNNGVDLKYPTKISERLIMLTDVENDITKKYLFYKKNSAGETNKPGVEVKIAKCEGNSVKGETIVLDAVTGLVSANNSLRKYGLDHNMPDFDSNGRPTLRNIYNYIQFSGGTPTLKKNLFTIIINGETKQIIDSQSVSSKNISIDLLNSTIQIKYKIIATENGFPEVTVVQKDSTNSECSLPSTISKAELKNTTITKNKQTAGEANEGKTSLVGFNLALFEDDSIFEDGNFVLGNIDVKLRMLWQTMSKPVDVSVAINEGNGTQLTGQVGNGLNNKPISDTSENECGSTGNGYLKGNHNSEIMSYQIFIVKNGYMYVNYLQEIIDKTKDTDKGAAAFAAYVYYKIFGQPVGNVNEYGKIMATDDLYVEGAGTVSGQKLGNGATGHILDTLDTMFLLALLDLYTDFKIYTSADNIDKMTDDEKSQYFVKYIDNVLEYRVVDAYELYSNNVDGNFFNNCMNTNDLVITQCFLEEHQSKQVNHYGGWLGWLWTADKGYSYYRAASAEYTVSKDNGSFASDYTNDLTLVDGKTNTKIKDPSFGQNIVSIFNSAKGKAGTYNRFITIGFAPSDDEFSRNESISAKTRIYTDAGKRVLTSLYDYQPVPIVNVVFDVFMSLLTSANPIGALVMVVDNILCIFQEDRRGIQDMFMNMF